MSEIAIYSTDAEQAVIGSVLIHPESFPELAIEADEFYLAQNRLIWEAFRRLDDGHKAIDYLTVQEQLKSEGKLDEVGGPAYLMHLINATISSRHVQDYAEIVRDRANRRGMLRLAAKMAASAHDLDCDLPAAQGRFIDQLFKSQRIGKGARHIEEFLSHYYDLLQAWSDNPREVYGLETGIRDFDRVVGGLQKKTTFILSGEPGIGKSILAFQMAMGAAEAGHAAAIYEMEMDGDVVIGREIASRTCIPTRDQRSGQIGSDQWPLLTNAIDRLAGLPVYLSTDTHWTTTTLRADLTRLKKKANIELAVVDYLFLLNDRAADDNERTALISRQLHHIAKDLDLAMIVVNSMVKSGYGAVVPSTESLRGSGQIGYDADLVGFLTRHLPEDGGPARANVRTLTLSKNREGGKRLMHLVQSEGIPAFKSLERPVVPTQDFHNLARR
jgi:replicative DNA helicase